MASVNLRIGETAVRIACDRRLARRLRRTYRSYLVDDEAPLGFVVQSPSIRSRRFVLLDRCGFNLGSDVARHRAATMLDNHLTALLPLSGDSHARFRVRAVTGTNGVSLCFFPLLFVPRFGLEEARSSGHDVVDRLAVDIDSRSGQMIHVSDPRGRFDGDRSGESDRGTQPLTVTRLILPTAKQLLAPSRSEAAASLCREAIAGAPEQILDAAVAVAESASITTVDVTEQSASLTQVL